MDSCLTPTLLESIQNVVITQIAVNSGGKHCLALTNNGQVYSWGEGDDGKLGHGNLRYVFNAKEFMIFYHKFLKVIWHLTDWKIKSFCILPNVRLKWGLLTKNSTVGNKLIIRTSAWLCSVFLLVLLFVF